MANAPFPLATRTLWVPSLSLCPVSLCAQSLCLFLLVCMHAHAVPLCISPLYSKLDAHYLEGLLHAWSLHVETDTGAPSRVQRVGWLAIR